jgi:hypothetical protein
MIRSPLRSSQAQRITALDSGESPNQICKKNPLQTPKSGKFDYFVTFNHPARSMASKNFTGDYVTCSVSAHDKSPANKCGQYREETRR